MIHKSDTMHNNKSIHISKAKISLPYSQACQLSRKQKIKLISCQAKRISMQDWEISALLRICKNKDWVNKGLAVLYEYAGHIDDFKSASEERSNCFEELLDYITKTNTCSIDEQDEALERIKSTVSSLVSSINILREWRNLQQSPQPVMFDNGDRNISWQATIREESQLILEALMTHVEQHTVGNGSKSAYCNLILSIELKDMAILLAPCMTFDDFLELYIRIKKLHQQDTRLDEYLKTLRDPNHSIRTVFNALREFLALEDRIEATWKSIRSMVHDGCDAESGDTLQSSYPILRLPYRDFKAPTQDMDWFDEKLPIYSSCGDTIATVVNPDQYSPINRNKSNIVLELQDTSPMTLRKTFTNNELEAAINRSSSEEAIQSPTNNSAQDANFLIENKPSHQVRQLDYLGPGDKLGDTQPTCETVRSTIPLKKPLRPTSAKRANTNSPFLAGAAGSALARSGNIHQRAISPTGSIETIDSGVKDSISTSSVQNLNLNNNNNAKDHAETVAQEAAGQSRKRSVTVAVVTNRQPENLVLQQLEKRRMTVGAVTYTSPDGIQMTHSATPQRNATILTASSEGDDRSCLSGHYELIYKAPSEDNTRIIELLPTISPTNDHLSPLDSVKIYRTESSPQQVIEPKFTTVRAHSANARLRATSRLYPGLDKMKANNRSRSPGYSYRTYRQDPIDVLDMLVRPLEIRESPKGSRQIVHYALRDLELERSGQRITVTQVAAQKISLWWQIVAPRKRLLNRISTRSFVHNLLHHIIDSAIVAGNTNHRRRITLMRHGAALKIQRSYRKWSETVLAEERRLEMEERCRVAWERLSIWTLCVLAGIRIYRYIRYAKKKKLIKYTAPKGSRNKLTLQRTVQHYIHTWALSKKLRIQKMLHKSIGVSDSAKHMLQHANGKRENMLKERMLAAVSIQRCYRKYHARQLAEQERKANIMGAKITFFLIGCVSKRRVREIRRKQRAITKIQTFLRGIRTRRMLFHVVSAGLRLNAMWRQHVAYKSLKSQLRRVDRPHTIVMYGLRNISLKTLNSNQISFKISVWWHPLLHIVSQNDYSVILQSKQPQFIYKSGTYYVQDEDQGNGRRVSISQGLRKLSSMLHSAPPRKHFYAQSMASGSNSDKISPKQPERDLKVGGSSRNIPFNLPPIPSECAVDIGIENTTTQLESSRQDRLDSLQITSPSMMLQLDSIESEEEVSIDDSASPLTFEEDDPRMKSSSISSRNEKEKTEMINGRSRRSFLQTRMQSMAVSFSSAGRSSRVEKNQPSIDGSGDPLPPLNRPHRSSGLQVSAMMTLAPISEPPNLRNRADDTRKDSTDASAFSSHAEFYQNIRRKQSTGISVMRTTLNMFSSGGSRRASQRPTESPPSLVCSFDDEIIKIPGCHGNSVIKFDILEGDRKYGTCVYYLSKGGEMMYWGGEYSLNIDILQQRRVAQFSLMDSNTDAHALGRNIHPGNRGAQNSSGSGKKHGEAKRASDVEPILDFRLIAGAPLRSKCSWGRMIVRGNGPLKRAVHARDVLGSLLFDKWRRFYFSLDEFGLFLYDNKYDTDAFFGIAVKDLRKVRVDKGGPVRHFAVADSSAKAIAEDMHNVKLTTYSGDQLFMRFPDSGTRVAWFEVLSNAIIFQRQYRNPVSDTQQKNWLAKSYTFANADSGSPNKGGNSSVDESAEGNSSASPSPIR